MNTVAQHVIDFLTAQSLHVLVLFALVLAVTIPLRGRSAHIRYLLWLLIVAKCLVPPLHTLPLAVLPERIDDGRLTMDDFGFANQPPSSSAATNQETSRQTPMSGEPTAVYAAQLESRLEAGGTAGERPTTGGTFVLTWVPAVWLGGAGVYFLILIVKGVRFDRYVRRHRTEATPQSHPAWAGFLSAALPEAKPLRLYQLSRSGQPFVWGLWRGAVYLPSNFADVHDVQKQQSILMHEAGHVLRLDPVVNILQVIAQGLFWFHPLVWLANGRIRAEREKCCDEFAVATLKTAPRHYCAAIVDALMAAQSSRPAIPTLAVAGPVKNIEDRIKSLLAPGKIFRTRPTAAAIISILLLAAIVVPTTIALTHKITPPDYALSGLVVDADGKPIAGAIVFDDGYGPEPYQKGITDANGKFEYKSWNEEHNVTAKAEGFAPQTITFTTWPFDNSKQLNFTLQRATEGELTALPNAVTEAILLPEHLESHTVLSLKTGQFIPQKQADDSKEPYLFYGYTFPPGANPSRYTVSTIPPECIGVSTGHMSLGGGAFAPESETVRSSLWSIQHREDFPDFKMSRMTRDVFNDISPSLSDGYFIHPHLGTSWPHITAFKGDDGTLGVFEITKVEDRKIHVRFKTLVTESVQKPEVGSQETEFTATLPNGVTVELLGVSEYPSEGKQWWSPQGTVLNEAPYATSGNKESHDKEGYRNYEFALRLKPEDVSYIWLVPGGSFGSDTGSPKNKNGRPLRDLKSYQTGFPEDQSTTTIRLGVTGGGWETAATQKPDNSEQTLRVGNYSIAFGIPYEKDSETLLPVVHTYNRDEKINAIRMVAVTTSGQLHESGYSGKSDQNLANLTYGFHQLPLREIKEFQFQIRPYEWVTFKNVSLRAGVKTEAGVEVQASEQPSAQGSPFSVQGHVTDANGKPVEGVTVRASCGWRTLMPTGRTMTDSEGRYRLRFGPGMRYLVAETDAWGVGFQAATIHAEKEGLYEVSLCKQGNLAMAGSDKQAAEHPWRQNFAGVVLPNQPYELNFVMAPAATIRGTVTDLEGHPLPDFKFSMTGQELYPSSSVLANLTTNEQGEFTVASVPAKTYRFEHTDKRGIAASAWITYVPLSLVTYRLVYDESTNRFIDNVESRPRRGNEGGD